MQREEPGAEIPDASEQDLSPEELEAQLSELPDRDVMTILTPPHIVNYPVPPEPVFDNTG